VLVVWKWLLGAVAICILAIGFSWQFSPCHDPGFQQTTPLNPENDCAGYYGATIVGVRSALDWLAHRDSAFWTAVAAAFIALFAFTLWRTASGQLRHLRTSLKFARDEFISTHRPILRIRNVALAHSTPVGNRPGINLIEENFPIVGTLEIVNVGETTATVVQSHCEAIAREEVGLPEKPAAVTPNDFAGSVKLKPAIPQTFKFQSISVMGDNAGLYRNLPEEGHRIFAIGWVRYVDERGTMRRTEFCRFYGVAKGERFPRFHKIDDADYDYED
jgi:hypothetical protein